LHPENFEASFKFWSISRRLLSVTVCLSALSVASKIQFIKNGMNSKKSTFIF